MVLIWTFSSLTAAPEICEARLIFPFPLQAAMTKSFWIEGLWRSEGEEYFPITYSGWFFWSAAILWVRRFVLKGSMERKKKAEEHFHRTLIFWWLSHLLCLYLKSVLPREEAAEMCSKLLSRVLCCPAFSVALDVSVCTACNCFVSHLKEQPLWKII